jgi:hypothetical protein
LSHLHLDSALAAAACASCGTVIPTAPAAATAAEFFKKSRLFNDIFPPLGNKYNKYT